MTTKLSPPVPAHGLPVNWTPAPCNKSEARARKSKGKATEVFHGPRLFTNGWHLCTRVRDDDVRLPMVTLMEIRMIWFMDEITEMAGWELDSNLNEQTLAGWKTQQKESRVTFPFSEKTFDYVFQELKHKAKVFKETGLISLYHGDVIKSRTAIPKYLLERLKAAALALEDDVFTSRRKKPRDVVTIVDPKEYNVNYRYTKVIESGVLDRETCLQRMNSGSPIRTLPDRGSDRTFVGWCTSLESDSSGQTSREYRKYGTTQWLPCDVDVSGDTPKILTYINNLHPREHAPLYTILEEILARVIPAWDMSLTPLRTFRFKRRIEFTAPDYGDIEAWMYENGPKLEDFKDKGYPEHMLWQARQKLYESKAHEFLREPQVSEDFRAPDPSNAVVGLQAENMGRGLQVIVRMTNIYLTPKHPLHDCSIMKFEGIPNDHICAVANYYYDVENVATEGCLLLGFPQKTRPIFDRNRLRHTLKYEWLEPIFGVTNGESSHIAIPVNVSEGRLITFPNLLSHTHQPFELVDRAENGHCKVLTFLLVDPNIRVMSSAIVPCQQYDWWVKEVTADGGPLGVLPYELRVEITQYIQKWQWRGSGYRKKSKQERINYKKCDAHTRFPGFSSDSYSE